MATLVVPDLISNSYFPAVAAARLGAFAEQGIEVNLELLFPIDEAYRALARGDVQIVGGSAHSALAGFPEWRGVKLLCAQAQGMYWFLVMRSDLGARRGEIASVKGKKLGAAPWVEMGLRQLLITAGIDLVRDCVSIAPVPGATGAGVNFGLTAAQALEEGKIDGFWANGMGAEVAVRRGVGDVILDVRRGDGPPECFHYTFSSMAASESLLSESPDFGPATVRAIVKTQRLLAADPKLAYSVARELFPPQEAELIPELIRRDIPYYDPRISRTTVAGMNAFGRKMGLLKGEPAYEDVVDLLSSRWWTRDSAR